MAERHYQVPFRDFLEIRFKKWLYRTAGPEKKFFGVRIAYPYIAEFSNCVIWIL